MFNWMKKSHNTSSNQSNTTFQTEMFQLNDALVKKQISYCDYRTQMKDLLLKMFIPNDVQMFMEKANWDKDIVVDELKNASSEMLTKTINALVRFEYVLNAAIEKYDEQTAKKDTSKLRQRCTNCSTCTADELLEIWNNAPIEDKSYTGDFVYFVCKTKCTVCALQFSTFMLKHNDLIISGAKY